MKRQPSEWEKIFANKASDKGLISVQFSSVAQSCPTLRNPMDCIVHGTLQPRIPKGRFKQLLIREDNPKQEQSRNNTEWGEILVPPRGMCQAI